MEGKRVVEGVDVVPQCGLHPGVEQSPVVHEPVVADHVVAGSHDVAASCFGQQTVVGHERTELRVQEDVFDLLPDPSVPGARVCVWGVAGFERGRPHVGRGDEGVVVDLVAVHGGLDLGTHVAVGQKVVCVGEVKATVDEPRLVDHPLSDRRCSGWERKDKQRHLMSDMYIQAHKKVVWLGIFIYFLDLSEIVEKNM